jgi:hypothetical protein
MSDDYTRREIITIVAVVLTVGAVMVLMPMSAGVEHCGERPPGSARAVAST